MNPPTTSPKRQHGCLFYGCISGAACLVLILLVFLLGIHLLRKTLNQYTDTAPMKLPVVQLSQPEIEQVQHRFENFTDAANSGRPTPPLDLTSDEVNALLQNDPNFRAAKGKFYVTIVGTNLQAQVSLPMTRLGLGLLKGRYLNGTATLAVSLQNGLLDLAPLQVKVKGQPLPEVYLEKIRHENFATGINNNPRASVVLSHLRSIELKDGKLILVPKTEK